VEAGKNCFVDEAACQGGGGGPERLVQLDDERGAFTSVLMVGICLCYHQAFRQISRTDLNRGELGQVLYALPGLNWASFAPTRTPSGVSDRMNTPS